MTEMHLEGAKGGGGGRLFYVTRLEDKAAPVFLLLCVPLQPRGFAELVELCLAHRFSRHRLAIIGRDASLEAVQRQPLPHRFDLGRRAVRVYRPGDAPGRHAGVTALRLHPTILLLLELGTYKDQMRVTPKPNQPSGCEKTCGHSTGDLGQKGKGLTFDRSREEALGIRLLERGVIEGAIDLEGIDNPVVVLGLLDRTGESIVQTTASGHT